MSATRNQWTDYQCRRLRSEETARYRYRPAGPETESAIESFEFFVLERYYLFAYRTVSNTLWRGQVSHAPYRYRDVELAELSTIPAQWDGFDDLDQSPDHACVIDALDVKIFAEEKV